MTQSTAMSAFDHCTTLILARLYSRFPGRISLDACDELITQNGERFDASGAVWPELLCFSDTALWLRDAGYIEGQESVGLFGLLEARLTPLGLAAMRHRGDDGPAEELGAELLDALARDDRAAMDACVRRFLDKALHLRRAG